MATIGSISVAFEADLGGFQDSIEELLKSFEELGKSVDDISKKFDSLDGRKVGVSFGVDTTAVDRASKKVEDLSDSISASSKKVEVDVAVGGDAEEELESTSEAAENLAKTVRKSADTFASAFTGQVVASAKAYGSSLKEIGDQALAATKPLGSAAVAVGQVLEGTSLSVDGLIKAAGRSFTAFDKWKEVLLAAGAATGAFLSYVGGARTVIAAATGNTAAMARVFAAAGGAVAVAGAGLAVYAGIVGLAKVATSGLSQESQDYAVRATKFAAATSVAAASIYVGNTAFAAIYQSIRTSSTAVEAFAKVAGSASSAASAGFAKVAASLGRLNLLLNVAKVFSGAYRQELSAMGDQAGKIQDMADRFGSTTQELQILARAASDAGISMGFLAKGQQNLFTSLSKIKIGQLNTESTREAKIAFDRLGISIEDLRAKRPQEVFDLVAERLSGVEDAADRTAIAFDLFGKQGAAILPALKNLKEVQADAARLGTTLGNVEFKAFDDLGKSFNRVREAAKNLASALLLPLAPIQTGWNNLIADVSGGIVAAFGPIASSLAAAAVPFQILLEVTGRVLNIILRLTGAVAKVATGFGNAVTLAGPWKVLGSAIMDVLSFIETFVSYVEEAANLLFSEFVPAVEGLVVPARTFGEWLEKIGTFAKYFAIVVIWAGVAQAALASFSAAGAATATSSTASAGLIAAAYEMMSKSVIASLSRVAAFFGITKVPFAAFAARAVAAFKIVVVGATNMAANVVSKMIIMGTSALQAWIAPFLAGVASFVTGTTVAASAATVSAAAMAAAWVVATLGLAVIGVAIAAVINNFDSLYEYFSDFKNGVGKLFTWEGIVSATKSAATAMYNAFVDAFKSIGRFFGGIAARVLSVFTGIKPAAEVEKIDAAAAKAEEVARKRRQVAQVEWERRNAVQVEFNAMGFGALPELEIEPPPVDETESLIAALEKARDRMGTLTVEAGKFGAAGKTAVIAAQEQFAKLQQQLSEGKLGRGAGEAGLSDAEVFEKRAKKIQSDLKKNLDLSNVLSTETVNDFAQSVAKSFDALQVRFDKLARGSDLGSTFSASRFFPTSNAIKQEAMRISNQLAAEEARIAKKLAEGGFGRDQDAAKRAAAELEDARFSAEREFGKIDLDISFANEIRKELENAFVSPAEALQKQLDEIDANKTLKPVEKALATLEKQRRFVETNFGKTAGETLRDQESAFEGASRRDEDGRNAFTAAAGSVEAGRARENLERNRLAVNRRQALGLDATPAQQLQAGIDNINDIFETSGLTLEQVQAKLKPEDFALYQEALKKNRSSVLEGLGVQKSGTAAARELAEKLKSAGASAEETSQAMRRQSESFMQSIGVQQTPMEQFASSMANISEKFGMAGKSVEEIRESLKGNAAELALFDRAVKTTRDNLLASLGVQKSPQAQFEEDMAKIEEARKNETISREDATQAELAAFRKRDQALGAGDNANDFGAQFVKQRKDIEEAFGKDGSKDPEKFALAMQKLNDSIPGADQSSPLAKFQNEMKKLNEIRDVIGEEAFNQNRLELQAGLEDSMGAALDSVGQDRRQVGAADVRSQAGVDTFFRILQGRDNPSLKAQLEIAKNTRLLAEAAQDPDAAPVIANFAAR